VTNGGHVPGGGWPRPLARQARIVVLLAASIMAAAGIAAADMFSDFVTPATPPHLTVTAFGSAYGAEPSSTSHQGLEFEQTVTRRLGILARLTAYQLYNGTTFDTPFAARPGAPFFFGRFEGGIDLNPAYGLHLLVLGGHDVGDSHSAVIEESASAWIDVHSAHPVNLSVTSSHYFENQLTNGLVDARIIAMSTDKLMLLAGAGVIIWGGPSVKTSAKAESGPDLGLFLRDWNLRLDLQAGYGTDREFGMLSVSRSFDWEE
jgi:hypothetical protein